MPHAGLVHVWGDSGRGEAAVRTLSPTLSWLMAHLQLKGSVELHAQPVLPALPARQHPHF